LHVFAKALGKTLGSCAEPGIVLVLVVVLVVKIFSPRSRAFLTLTLAETESAAPYRINRTEAEDEYE
jgi:hypothetical protein